MRCLHCHAETSNGLALCELCRRFASTSLDVLPVYFRNLARQRRPGRPNGSLGITGQWLIRRGEIEGSAVTVALERVANDLGTWARALSDDRGVDLPDGDTEAEVIAAVCALLEVHLSSIATLEWAGQFVRDVGRHERILRELTESVVPGWYAGACRRCEVPTYVVPGLTWVTCRGCGATTYARDHLNTVIGEASDWVARPMRLAETVVALIDTEQSIPRLHKRISKWGERGQIAAVRALDADGDPVGPKRFRLGDVLDLLFSEGATRQDDETAEVS